MDVAATPMATTVPSSAVLEPSIDDVGLLADLDLRQVGDRDRGGHLVAAVPGHDDRRRGRARGDRVARGQVDRHDVAVDRAGDGSLLQRLLRHEQ